MSSQPSPRLKTHLATSTSRCFLHVCLSERHLATFNQLMFFFVNLLAGGTWPLSIHRRNPYNPVPKSGNGHFHSTTAFCMREVDIASCEVGTQKAKWCMATLNQHYHFSLAGQTHIDSTERVHVRVWERDYNHFACKKPHDHFHPSQHFAISSMGRKGKSPVTVCGNASEENRQS